MTPLDRLPDGARVRRWVDPKGQPRWGYEIRAKHGSRWVKRNLPAESTKADIKAALDDLKADIRSGELDKPEQPKLADQTISVMFAAWLADCSLHDRPNTQANKESHVRFHIVPRLGKLKLTEISDTDITAFKRYLLDEADLEVSSANVVLATLGSALRAKLGAAAPRVRNLRGDEEEVEPRYLTFEELALLLEKASGMWRTLILTGAKTGLRPGELMGMKWPDVDAVLHVRRTRSRGKEGAPKTKKSKRDVPLTPSVVEALKALPRNGDYVFNKDGKPLEAWWLRDALAAACKAAGLVGVHPHTLRHTFASHLVMRGVPLEQVSRLMGHSNLAQTMRYAHLAPRTLAVSVGVLDEPAPV